LRIDLAYDGTNFFGWGKQPDRRSVQEEVEKAIGRITQTKIDSIVAGRTDAGVHATGQVIHVDVPESTNLDEIAYKLNRILDEDIRIMGVSIAPEAFHARFSALRRSYTYKILDKNLPIPPINRLDIASWYRPLDVDLMNKASSLVLGHHDFAAFCKFREGGTTIRTLERFQWERQGDLLIASIIADAFCYSMVRNLVGAVVCVADARKDATWMGELLANKERVSDSLVFPARGLTLASVEYPTNDQLLERARVTIGKRSDGSH
jgi:tRNA pseudouridine38-40 synthase